MNNTRVLKDHCIYYVLQFQHSVTCATQHQYLYRNVEIATFLLICLLNVENCGWFEYYSMLIISGVEFCHLPLNIMLDI